MTSSSRNKKTKGGKNMTLSMKLLIETQSQRVLFAEASKETVDFIFHFLTLPVATIVRLLREQGMVGSLANLYASIENLSESYIQSCQTKETFLKPKPPVGVSSVPLLLLKDAPAAERKFYMCNPYCGYRVSDDPSAVCPQCNRKMATAAAYIPPAEKQSSAEEGGLVKGVVTYMIMDNLVVKPMSTISSITLLNTFKVKDVRTLQEQEVNLGMDEATRLLKASLQSEKVLTDVFLSCK